MNAGNRIHLRRWMAVLLVVSMASAACEAGPTYDTFRAGVFGIPWGTSLDELVGIFPAGDHMFAVTPGHRAYWVKEGQPFLGVPREHSGVLYALDEHNRVYSVAVAFEFERKIELKNALTFLLGPPTNVPPAEQRTQYGWRKDGGISIGVTEFGLPHQQIIWLVVAASAPYPAAK